MAAVQRFGRTTTRISSCRRQSIPPAAYILKNVDFDLIFFPTEHQVEKRLERLEKDLKKDAANPITLERRAALLSCAAINNWSI